MLQIYAARLALVYSLAHLGDPQAQAEQARMSGQATHRKWILRFHAQIAPKRLDALTSGLADRSVEVREFATRLVLEHPDENLLPALAPLLADGNEMVRDRAAECLRACASHNEELLASVLGQLRRTDKMAAEVYTAPPTSTRVLVLQSLRYANSSPGVLRHLLELLDGSDKAVLPHLPETLVYHRNRSRLLEEMRARLGGENRNARAYALYTLALLDEPGCAGDFLQHLPGSRDPVVVSACAEGLARLNVADAVPVLKEALVAWPEAREEVL